MPYSIETRDGIVINNIPDGISRDAPELRQRVTQARAQRQEQMSRDAAQATLEDMPWGERALVNVGAGMRSLGQGVQQLASKIGLGDGPSNDELREQRFYADRAAEGTRGGRLLQVAGEVAPTIPAVMLGGGLLGGLAARTPALVPAANAARAYAAANPVKAAALAGAVGGGAGGALSPVIESQGESRVTNAAMGAAAGAVLNPVLARALPATGRALAGLARGVRDTMNPEGAAQRLLLDAVPEAERTAIATSMRTAPGESVPGAGASRVGPRVAIPETAAQRAGDPTLARLEAASRANPATADEWVRFDTARNAAVYDELQGLTPSALRVERQKTARDLATGPVRERALALVDKAGTPGKVLLDYVEALDKGPSGANPDVRKVVAYVRSVIDPDSSAARVYEARKALSEKLAAKATMGDELGSAAKSARREVAGIIDAVDSGFNGASDGLWSNYLADYAARSKPITSGQALQGIGEDLAHKPLMGAVPQVTASNLQRAITANGQGRFGSKFAPEAAQQLEALTATLRRGEMPGRVRKISGTMGGGSNTAIDLAQMAAGHVPVLGGIAQGAVRGARQDVADATARALADALQDPQAAARLLGQLPPGAAAQFLQQFRQVPAVQAGAEILMRSGQVARQQVRQALVVSAGQQQEAQ
ncbi:hypothetical protein [Mitsuaria sp. GD03876]|uniref:hypothetical protein n=1 Tax=Mitsuaria sp. GD03876 TaxID=2975399 RepID=UPI0024481CC1|nr:hypothetical protein [Mitsuaria sp. GD03876]MDH0866609.1 hypothetical protein [Mitsuaria sp. GD03876]